MMSTSPLSPSNARSCVRIVLAMLCAAMILPRLAIAGGIAYESVSDEEREAARYVPIPTIGPRSYTSILPLNPVVQALMDSVSIERLEESLVKMVDFHTRNSASDTSSTTTGTGAARRWALEQLAVYSAAHGGSQATGYFDFTENICGLMGPHRNVIALQTGSVHPDRHYVLGAHYDNRSYGLCDAVNAAPGADDNATGCAATLEVAYLLGQLEAENSLLLALFAGEEQGTFGSAHYATHVHGIGLDIQGMISVDGIGNISGPGGEQDSTRCLSFSHGPGNSPARQFTRYIKLKGEAYQPDFEVGLVPEFNPTGYGSDHVSFHNQGYPATWVMERFVGPWHTALDTPDRVNFPYMTRITRVNVAALSSLVLAPKPPEEPMVADFGNGTEVEVNWSPGSEPDLAGYRVAYRYEVGDSLYYHDIYDAGLATSHTISGLTEGEPILASVSAYDVEFNESVFGEEQRIAPSSLPSAPAGFEATSHADRVDLDWTPNSELDIAGYNLYRSTSPASGYALLASIPHPTAHHVDGSVAPGTLYYYRLIAVDSDTNESEAAGPEKGRLVDHALDILIVDATADGTGGLIPIDAAVDLFYAGMLSDVPVAGEWDRADSLAVGNLLSDADLGAHRTVVYHIDATVLTATTQRDTMVLRKYLQHGGRLLLSGSKISFMLAGETSFEPISWEPGSFMHDVMQATETRQSDHFDFSGAFGQQPGYPHLDVDNNKIIFDRLSAQDAYTGPILGTPTTEVLYHYQSYTGGDPNHQLPDAIRFLSPEMRLVAFSFPLFFMDSLSVRQTIASALEDLGEGATAIAAGSTTVRLQFGLAGATPNPFNPAARIEYVADRGEHLLLRIYDVQGRLIRTLVDGWVEPGSHAARWVGVNDAGAAVGSGVYFVELSGQRSRRTARHKVVMIR